MLILVILFVAVGDPSGAALTSDHGKTLNEFFNPISGEHCSNVDFTCLWGSINCVMENKTWDGIQDCEDGLDEHNYQGCTAFGNCFYCGNNKTDCIVAHWRCEGERTVRMVRMKKSVSKTQPIKILRVHSNSSNAQMECVYLYCGNVMVILIVWIKVMKTKICVRELTWIQNTCKIVK